MKKIFSTTTINLTPDEVKEILLIHFGIPRDGTSITFNVGNVSDRGPPLTALTGVSLITKLPVDVSCESAWEASKAFLSRRGEDPR